MLIWEKSTYLLVNTELLPSILIPKYTHVDKACLILTTEGLRRVYSPELPITTESIHNINACLVNSRLSALSIILVFLETVYSTRNNVDVHYACWQKCFAHEVCTRLEIDEIIIENILKYYYTEFCINAPIKDLLFIPINYRLFQTLNLNILLLINYDHTIVGTLVLKSNTGYVEEHAVDRTKKIVLNVDKIA
ncbi:hypothetical protein QTP88_022367 [Uroleucon formosanum]